MENRTIHWWILAMINPMTKSLWLDAANTRLLFQFSCCCRSNWYWGRSIYQRIARSEKTTLMASHEPTGSQGSHYLSLSNMQPTPTAVKACYDYNWQHMRNALKRVHIFGLLNETSIVRRSSFLFPIKSFPEALLLLFYYLSHKEGLCLPSSTRLILSC